MRDPAESLNRPCDLIAFLDESRKPVRDGRTGRVSGQGDHYVVVAAVVLAADADDCRSLIRAAATDAEATRKPRWKLMSPTRRRMAVARLTELDHWDAIAYETARPIRNRRVSDAKARSLILRRAFADLHWQRGVRRATLETRSKPSEGLSPTTGETTRYSNRCCLNTKSIPHSGSPMLARRNHFFGWQMCRQTPVPTSCAGLTANCGA